jgi:hypothetical protein
VKHFQHANKIGILLHDALPIAQFLPRLNFFDGESKRFGNAMGDLGTFFG